MTTAHYQGEDKFYVSVDCIIVGFTGKDLTVLLGKREIEPDRGKWSLMGGFVKPRESINEAAARVLTESSGIHPLFMEQVGAYGDVSRDTADRVISVAYYSLVDMQSFKQELADEHHVAWTKLGEIPDLVSDHKKMISDAFIRLKRIATVQPVIFHLLPEKFTLPQLQHLYEALYQTSLDKRNFRKKIHALELLKKLNEKDKKSSKRGAFYYCIHKEKYNQLVKTGFSLSL